MYPTIKNNSTDLSKERFNEHLNTFHTYTKKEKSKSSRRAYSFGWKKFKNWLKENDYSLPEEHDPIALLVGLFLSDMAKNSILRYKSLVSYHAAIKYHVYEQMGIILDHQEIRKAMRGIRNDLKQAPVKKTGIKIEHISTMFSDSQQSIRLIDLRDKALLLLGFSGAFRRSELIGINYEHISFDPEGISIHIPFSKSDQAGEGQHVEIPYKEGNKNCPIAVLLAWLNIAGIRSGPIFRPISKHGKILEKRLSDKSVALVVKKRGKNLFEDIKNISGHSLRRGFVLTAMENDVPALVIMNQTRHASFNTLKEYTLAKKNYKTNALNSLKF